MFIEREVSTLFICIIKTTTFRLKARHVEITLRPYRRNPHAYSYPLSKQLLDMGLTFEEFGTFQHTNLQTVPHSEHL